MMLPLAYMEDLLAQRWHTDPVWIREECPWGWRELGFLFMSLEGSASVRRSANASTEKTDGRESFEQIRARRMRQKAQQELSDNG